MQNEVTQWRLSLWSIDESLCIYSITDCLLGATFTEKNHKRPQIVTHFPSPSSGWSARERQTEPTQQTHLCVSAVLCVNSNLLITEMLTPYEPAHSLRSLGGALLAVPKLRLMTNGDRAFTIRAPQLWNDLPEEIRLVQSFTSFKSLLNNYFYRLAFM